MIEYLIKGVIMKKEWKKPELQKVQVKKITLSGSGTAVEQGDLIHAARARPQPN